MSIFFPKFFLVIKLLCIFAVEKIEEVNHTNKKQIFKLYEKVYSIFNCNADSNDISACTE